MDWCRGLGIVGLSAVLIFVFLVLGFSGYSLFLIAKLLLHKAGAQPTNRYAASAMNRGSHSQRG